MVKNIQMSLFDKGQDTSSDEAKAQFEKAEAPILVIRSQTIATLSTIATLVPSVATPPFSEIDPYTIGLMAIGHVIDALLIDIEESDLTVRGLIGKVSSDLENQFRSLHTEKKIDVMPVRAEMDSWSKGIVDKLLCKKELGKKKERLFDAGQNTFYDFPHSLLEEQEKASEPGSIFVKPTPACLTLYLGTLTQSIGDAQAASAAVIQRQFQRGEYFAARQRAAELYTMTKQHCMTIHAFKRKLKADAAIYGWSASVFPLIEEALLGVDDVMSIVDRLENELENVFETLPYDKQAMAEKIMTIIRQARVLYRDLQSVTMGLSGFYTECLETQGLATKHILLPSMREDVFFPLFNEVTDLEQLEIACDAVNFGCEFAAPPPLFDPIACTEILLKSYTKEEFRDESGGLECEDEVVMPFTVFDADVVNAVELRLAQITSPTLLSEIAIKFCREEFYEEANCLAIVVSTAWGLGRPLNGNLKPTRTYNEYECHEHIGDDYMITVEGT